MNPKMGVVGLGYVGLPIALAFSRTQSVLGFDTNKVRIDDLISGYDYTGEVESNELKAAKIKFTSDEKELLDCNFIIVTVPTPIDNAKQPDLTYLIKACSSIGRNLTKGTIIVFESTVFPGTTEEICIPIIEEYSNFESGKDFFVGYSPERINPGDKNHSFENVVKIVSAQDDNTLSIIAKTYGQAVQAGIYCAPTIKVAEAAKVIENTQRDLNIALMNELAIIFDRLEIDTEDVLQAARTKWNFLDFKPGLVGGHCIGVDSYYLTYKAESIGYHPEVILAGRRINDSMGKYIATALIKQMIKKGSIIQGSIVTILGLSFKENVSDIRNTKVVDIINELHEFGIEVQVYDPVVRSESAFKEYGLQTCSYYQLRLADALVLAVPHKEFLQWGSEGIRRLLKNEQGIVIDVKSVLDRDIDDLNVWRL